MQDNPDRTKCLSCGLLKESPLNAEVAPRWRGALASTGSLSPRLNRSTCPGALQRIFNQRGSALELELFASVEAVRFDGFRAQAQNLADLARGQTLSEETKHLKFTVGQLAKGGIVLTPAA